jgi:threonine dehydrogenase-like Zn-dependent dehydrogenase
MEFIGGQRQGGLSELVTVPAANLVPMDPGVPPDRRVLVEPLAVGVHAVARAEVAPEERVLVIGAGPIGLFTALALRSRGVEQIVLTDLSDDRLALARRLGAGETVNTRDVSLDDYVRDAVRPDGVDVAFDCVGLEATTADALRLTSKGGRVILVGLMPADLTVDGVALQRGERALVGVQQYVREDYGTAMEILASGALPAAEELIRSYRLEDVVTAFRDLQEGRTDVLKYAVAP